MLQAQIAEWLANGETGISSESIALWLGFGVKQTRWGNFNHPHDPDDLNRCLKLLRDVPALRPMLPRMAEVGPVWAALVERWDELEQCQLDEIGIDWCKARSAPRTYALMRSIIDEAREGSDGRG